MSEIAPHLLKYSEKDSRRRAKLSNTTKGRSDSCAFHSFVFTLHRNYSTWFLCNSLANNYYCKQNVLKASKVIANRMFSKLPKWLQTECFKNYKKKRKKNACECECVLRSWDPRCYISIQYLLASFALLYIKLRFLNYMYADRIILCKCLVFHSLTRPDMQINILTISEQCSNWVPIYKINCSFSTKKLYIFHLLRALSPKDGIQFSSSHRQLKESYRHIDSISDRVFFCYEVNASIRASPVFY